MTGNTLARRAALLLALVVPLAGLAQAGPGPRPGAPGARMFDPKNVTTVRGEVLEVQRIDGPRGQSGVHAIVAVGAEKLPVLLGPAFYVDAQELKLAKGDRIEVLGSRVTIRGAPALVAQEIRRGDQVLKLRDEQGLPRWRGPGRARR